MIELVTLFLGLVVGERTVEFQVSGGVAAVEIVLDGEKVGVLTRPPWRLEVDFGPLRPHLLAAVARDAAGQELDRVERTLNLAQSTTEAAMRLVTDDEGLPRAVSLSWESVGRLRPSTVEVFFDGESLVVDDPQHVPLPEYDPASFHFVSAVVHFEGLPSRRLEARFGGGRASEISTDLTAVAVTVDRGALRRGDEMSSWFLAAGEPVVVHGVERRQPQILLVRDPRAQPILDELARQHLSRDSWGNPWDVEAWHPETFFSGAPEEMMAKLLRYGFRLRGLTGFAPFGREIDLLMVSPLALPISPAGVTPSMFLHSASATLGDSDFLSLTRRRPPMEFPRQIVDAVAVAGMVAQAGNRPRAVVVILADTRADTSLYPIDWVRAYLAELQVPLYVWTLGPGLDTAAWGEVRHLGDLAKPAKALAAIERGVGELMRDLDKQRVVWLRGRHLPGAIELIPAARRVRLVR